MIEVLQGKTQEYIFDRIVYLSYFLMIVSSLGINAYAPKYAHELNLIITLYVSIVLVWRFHPLRTRVHFTNLDRKIAFSAGLFIITTTFLNKYIEMAHAYSLTKYVELKQALTPSGLLK